LDKKEKEKDRYAEFIVSDIINSCHTFKGEAQLVRFHPIMANMAMNMFIGIKYDDIRDIFPFCFPTVRSVQRSRAKVSTHEGTAPKTYARVCEMG
jgi:hypothetical protein